MKRPVPPSNFRSSGDTAEDLRRIRQHQQEILDWIDAQIDEVEEDIAALPVGVTSFNTRTGAIVPATGDYTATQVGLGNVTNDAQLKRAGSDWSGFTTQTGSPAAGDKFLIERASDSGKRVVLASSLSTSRDPIWDRPTTPSADDEEFDTDVLASGGVWTIGLSGTPGTAMTRDGAIDLTQNIASGHYRSSCLGSTLFVQLRPNEFATIWKTVAAALTTSQIWFAGIGGHQEPGTANANNPFMALTISKNLSGAPDLANRHVYRALTNGNERNVLTTVSGGVASADVISATPIIQMDGMAIRVDHPSTTGTNFSGWMWRRNGNTGFICQSQTSNLAFNASTDKIGITVGANGTVQVVPFVTSNLFALHFLRRVPTAGGWLAQA